MSAILFYVFLVGSTCIGPIMGAGHGEDLNNVAENGIQQQRQFGLGVPAEIFVDTLLSLYRTQIQILGINSFTAPQLLLPASLSEFNVHNIQVHGIGSIARYGPITTQIGLLSSSLSAGMELTNVGANFSYGSTGESIHYNCPSITIESKFVFKADIPFPKIGLETFALNSSSCSGGDDDIFTASGGIVGIIDSVRITINEVLNNKMVPIFGDILGTTSQLVFG